jgi:hypothetical protein
LNPSDGREPLGLEADNVIFMNSLQVIYSERFVFSADGNWELVREMVASNPELKVGPRFAWAETPTA